MGQDGEVGMELLFLTGADGGVEHPMGDSVEADPGAGGDPCTNSAAEGGGPVALGRACPTSPLWR